MPSYRGIDKQDVVKSIRDMIDFIDQHQLGPETQKHTRQIKGKLSAVARAKSDVALAHAIGATGIEWLLLRLHDYWQYHAIKNTKKSAADIFDRLDAWGAFHGMRTLEFGPIDAEVKNYLSRQKPLSPAQNSAGYVSAAVPFLIYGIAIDDLTKRKINEHDSSVLQLKDQVGKALQPFSATHEVQMFGIGFLGLQPQYDPATGTISGDVGIIFVSTPRAAQAVASALPQHQVLDPTGNIVVPASAAPKKKNGGQKPKK